MGKTSKSVNEGGRTSVEKQAGSERKEAISSKVNNPGAGEVERKRAVGNETALIHGHWNVC
jgi:hypothetical protein